MSDQIQYPPAPEGTPAAPSERANPWGRRVLGSLLVLFSGVIVGTQIDTAALREAIVNPSATASSPSAQSGSSGSSNQGSSNSGTYPGSGIQPGQGGWGQGSSGSGGNSTTTTSTSRTTLDASDKAAVGMVLITASSSSSVGAGTGMVVDSDGTVVTNYHVVEGSTAVSVEVVSTGAHYTAVVLGRDVITDVAVLKLQNAGPLATVTLDQDGLAVGDEVSAVGNANGQGYLSSATGTVTSLSESITVSDGEGVSTLSDMIGTTAAAVPGDSGGAMVDEEGEVVGMTSAGTTSRILQGSGQATSYAIPVKAVTAVLDQVLSGTSSGTTIVGGKGQLGVGVQSAGGGLGVQVAQLTPGGPASGAGIQVGDIITSVDGRTVTSTSDLATVMATLSPAQRVQVAWLDSTGTRRTAAVTLTESTAN